MTVIVEATGSDANGIRNDMASPAMTNVDLTVSGTSLVNEVLSVATEVVSAVTKIGASRLVEPTAGSRTVLCVGSYLDDGRHEATPQKVRWVRSIVSVDAVEVGYTSPRAARGEKCLEKITETKNRRARRAQDNRSIEGEG